MNVIAAIVMLRSQELEQLVFVIIVKVHKFQIRHKIKKKIEVKSSLSLYIGSGASYPYQRLTIDVRR